MIDGEQRRGDERLSHFPDGPSRETLFDVLRVTAPLRLQYIPQKVSILNRQWRIRHPSAFKNLAIKNAETKNCESGKLALLAYRDKGWNESQIVSEYLWTHSFRAE
jgi:hypothetical protein